MTPRRKAASKPDARADERARHVNDDAAVSALLDRLTDGVSALPEALEQAEKDRRLRAEATRELLASPELRRMAGHDPDLRRKITSARDEEDRKDASTERAIAELRDAADEWLGALKTLRDLGG
jgi:hypothetical protein